MRNDLALISMIYCFPFQMIVRFVQSLKINNMKKMRLFVIGALSLLSTNLVKAQALEQGNVAVDVYYGWGQLFGSILQESANAVDIDFRNFGTLGFRAEYMVSDRFGLGLEVNYKKTTLAKTRSDGGTGFYEDEISWTRFRVMPRFNFHYVQADKVDVYSAIAVGYSNHNFNYSSTEPNYSGDQFTIPLNIGFRVATGMRYFFTDNIGAGIEFGLGGGDLIHFGICARF
jgi:opacity protein-like surface antigen